MRALTIVVATGLFIASLLQASAQALLDGPLAAPGLSAPPPVTPGRKSSTRGAGKPKTTHHAARPIKPDTRDGEASARDVPVVGRTTSPPDDPLSLGMKWNGSNDNGSQTRVQNYNGSAAGTGAEVGLKLHF